MTDDLTTDDRVNPPPRWAIGLIGSLPLSLLVGVYLSNISSWDVWLSYGGIVILLVLLIAGFFAGLIFEWKVRRKQTKKACKAPWFTLVGFVFLCLWPLAIYLARPIVFQNPHWCRVSQAIHWETDLPHPTHSGNQIFALVFHARGNRADHHFQSAYLNWSGEGPAGFSKIDLANETFSGWEDGEKYSIEMTRQALRDNIGQSGIDTSDADRIADEIWQTLQLAKNNKPIVSANGNVGPIWLDPFDYEDIKLGSVVWMALHVLAFVWLAQVTLQPPISSESVEVV